MPRGLHGWVVYTLVGLLLALMAHREGLPLTMKSCFYPLIGDRIFGWPGDLVDILRYVIVGPRFTGFTASPWIISPWLVGGYDPTSQ